MAWRDEGGLQHQILRLVAGEEHLRQRHEVGARAPRPSRCAARALARCRRYRRRVGLSCAMVSRNLPGIPGSRFARLAYRPAPGADKGGVRRRGRKPLSARAAVTLVARSSPRGSAAKKRVTRHREIDVRRGAGSLDRRRCWRRWPRPPRRRARQQVLTKEYDNGGVYEGDLRRRPAARARAPTGCRTATSIPATGSRAASRARARRPIPTARSTRARFVAGQPGRQGQDHLSRRRQPTRATGSRAAIDGPGRRDLCRRLALRGRLRRRPAAAAQGTLTAPGRLRLRRRLGRRRASRARAASPIPTARATRAAMAGRRAARAAAR